MGDLSVRVVDQGLKYGPVRAVFVCVSEVWNILRLGLPIGLLNAVTRTGTCMYGVHISRPDDSSGIHPRQLNVQDIGKRIHLQPQYITPSIYGGTAVLTCIIDFRSSGKLSPIESAWASRSSEMKK